MTNVPQLQFTANGVVAPTEQDILAGVQADMDAAFGGGVNPDLTTPQGQLATAQAAIVGAKNDEILYVSQQVDPAYASGRFQDAIARIYFLERQPATPTTVDCVCTGAVSTVIPTGALASDGQNTWVCTSGGAIPVGGSITLPFACTVNGPIACPANSVNAIYQTINGWDTVNNPSPGVLGTNVESRADFELRREESVAANSRGTVQAVKGAVLAVPDVVDAYAYQNDSSGADTVGGVSLNPNSLYVCASGGGLDAIAEAIWSKKSPGCAYTGTTTRTVYDTIGYSPPYPSYSVSFTVASALAIKVAVTITNSSAVPSNANTLIQDAIIAAFAGQDGGSRVRIGAMVYASRYYAPVVSLGDWAKNIVSIKVGTVTANQDDVTVNIDQIPTVQASDISVTFV